MESSGIGVGGTGLVESAAGAVGTLVLQLARTAGAKRLIGLARGAEKIRLVRESGADAAVDYTEPDWPAQVRRAAPDGVTVALDGVGGETGRNAFELLTPGGRFVVFGFSGGGITRVEPAEAAERGVTVVSYFGPPTADRRARPAGPAPPDPPGAGRRGGRTAAAVRRPARFPLAEAAAAHAAISARSTAGKTVLFP
ncbi:zinc-binding dehydrogenase [Actinacidiphila sp. ITFR-21]|uniref:zinc-binding dehydrogenase n=1 Tax=Actinacidiphila sp. ITFR-21 TaxID=3075199 RepID=UPI00288AC36D|nr:zinc-binding dehydrogenase [Streptomyces sp. ITFR-21]WNI18238.1 zinc-binding dehydrogenase [Streptomyces sp. ITFR-21]